MRQHIPSHRCGALLLVLSVAAPAIAEVIDKEPTLREIWWSAVPLAVLALVAGRLHPVLGFTLLLVPNMPLGMLSEVRDPSVGSVIRAEAGTGYVFQVYGANALLLVCYLLGVVLWQRDRLYKRAHMAEQRRLNGEYKA